ncbi:hypothetical protein [uncultured Parvibaculum sp.]|uniref:hypothetical protein n=1 Tax=uncultured Parvibaculum sp. TaxID=291828 RepID=UPI0030DD5DD8
MSKGSRSTSVATRGRLLRICLLVGLLAAVLVLALFGLNLWSFVVLAFLIACPLAVIWVLMLERQPRDLSENDHEQ